MTVRMIYHPRKLNQKPLVRRFVIFPGFSYDIHNGNCYELQFLAATIVFN